MSRKQITDEPLVRGEFLASTKRLRDVRSRMSLVTIIKRSFFFVIRVLNGNYFFGINLNKLYKVSVTMRSILIAILEN